MKAKKSLGQNFLRDSKILQKIVDFAHIDKADTVLEIGPGEGTLTKLLLEKAGQVLSVEKDEQLAKELQAKFAEEIKEKRSTIIAGDILEIADPIIHDAKYKLVGNIPYYITGEIFRKFLEIDRQPESMTFVIQREVAERIMARDGKESVLSISIKAYGTPEYGGIIKAGSFTPRPKVDSAIITVRDISRIRFGAVKEKRFFEILKRGFSHKRKLLCSNLEVSPQFLAELGISEKARAENLTLQNWLDIAEHPQNR